MSLAAKYLEDETFRSIAKPIQQDLKMQDWEYQLSWQPPQDPKHYMECVTNLNRKVASIRVRKDESSINPPEFEKCILHEMIHPILEGIRAEHKLQMESLETDRGAEYFQRISIEVEKAVDHLTKIIYDLRTCCREAEAALIGG